MKCKRCSDDKARVLTKSPVGDVWEVYICYKCFYSWRSTEQDLQISEQFLLTDDLIANMSTIPPVPPLKKSP